MPYVFRETQVGEARPATEFPSLTSEVLTETFAQTFEENPVAAMVRAKQLNDDYREGTRLDAATARQKLAERGMENDITVSDAGITESALNTLMFRKGVEKRRQEVFGLAEGGIGQGAARLGVGLATSLVDPVSVATAFIPVVSQSRYLSMLGRAAGIGGRTAVRAGVGAIEGVAGAALLEPIIAASRRYEQADYDMADSLLNVAFGGLFGSGLHTTFGAVSDGVRHIQGTQPTWRGLEGLTAAESQLVLNLRAEIADGMDLRDIGRATADWSPAMRKAVEPDLPKMTPAEAAHQALPPQLRENVLKQAIVDGITGGPSNVPRIVEAAAKRQTETPEFKRWFGESKVVDEAGQPLVVYHGTLADIADFDGAQHFGTSRQANEIISTIEGVNARRVAQGQGPERQGSAAVYPVHLSIKNPKRVEDLGGHSAKWAAEIAQAKAEGHDGLVYQNFGEFDPDPAGNPRDSYVAFYPQQIKSAIGNSGRFDPNSASLTDPLENPAKAAEYADKVLAREVDTGTPTADALKMATDEAALAQSDLKALADRLGVEAEDAELRSVLEAAANSERWAKAAELATVCLVRGG